MRWKDCCEDLFKILNNIIITSRSKWVSVFLDWSNGKYDTRKRKMRYEKHRYEVLQGKDTFESEQLDGWIDGSSDIETLFYENKNLEENQ